MALTFSFFFLKSLFIYVHQFFSKKIRLAGAGAVHRKYPKHQTPAKISGDGKVLIFNVEEGLLKPSSPFFFSYFMLVAFEGGGVLRATALLMSYPLIRLVGKEMGLKIMVMISFFGVKKESFRIGSSVLAKYFLNDVGLEAFEGLRRGGKRIGFSNYFPKLMIESFLREYLEVEVVVGRDLKVFCGYFVGLMDKKVEVSSLSKLVNVECHGEKEIDGIGFQKNHNFIGICGSQKGYDFHLLSSICNEIYMVNEVEKKRWKRLPRDKYIKPLVFHDGRLALNPTPLNTFILFMWFPFALILALIRILATIFLPYNLCIPINAFSGMLLTISSSDHDHDHINQGLLYVCNHRTLLDPLYVSSTLKISNPSAVTYSLSRVSEFFSPIRTVRLTRNRDRDAALMTKLLSDGNLIVCPEGTTCREPYLLRFSPLFSEVGAKIVPIANDTHVSMFYGTTASGFKCLDPMFFLMNPKPSYDIKKLDMVDGLLASQDSDQIGTRFDVANCVQSEIGKALEFECTKLTRRDKYLILAGNEGIV